MTGAYEVKDNKMARYLVLVQDMMTCFEFIMFELVPRSENEQADALANLTFTLPRLACSISLKSLDRPSIDATPIF
ncbi:hypothetical protein AAG906_035787 [Vitis piasezkii]